MTLKQSIHEDMKFAMKSGDTFKRDVLRFLESAIGKEEVDKNKRDAGLADDEVVQIVVRSIKQRRDSAQQYRQGGRNELAEKEESEIAFLQAYLPQQASPEEITLAVDQAINQTGAKTKNDMGKVMGIVMQRLRGKVDGDIVRAAVESKLS